MKNTGVTEITTNVSPTTDVFSIIDATQQNQQLAVNFKIKGNGVVYSRELNVRLTAFPDYVFSKEYSLMDLKELEEYIKVNKHLPNVPTASQIEQDGANVGELIKTQMEKIEELTLYTIELKKEVEALKKRLDKK
jgi:hypothetical protein